jgi:hypothetical protein
MSEVDQLMTYYRSDDIGRQRRKAQAECTPQEIATITGHSLRDVGAIMDRYSAPTDRIAVSRQHCRLGRTVSWLT